MKFLSNNPIEVEDKKLKIKMTVKAPTNAIRFDLYDLCQTETLAARIKLAEHVFTAVILSLCVAGKEIDPADMIGIDLADGASSDVYFACVDKAVTAVLGGDGDEEDERKK